jgi:hypothetical protein
VGKASNLPRNDEEGLFTKKEIINQHVSFNSFVT